MKLLFLVGRFGLRVEAGLDARTPTPSAGGAPSPAPEDPPATRKKYPTGFTRQTPAATAEEG